ncbi:uncharacterized protein LOC112539593 [Tetranychus urticae]|nr:uncharacterized protein LOC112539593 [Tetranychus urticae]
MAFGYLKDYEWASEFTIENEIGQSCQPDEIAFLDWESLDAGSSSKSSSSNRTTSGELSLNNYLDQSKLTIQPNDKARLGEIKDVETLNLRLSAYLESAKLTEFHIEELMQLIISLLNDKSKPHSHLESELMDLLGFGAIDLIREIIQNHQSIIKSHKSLYQEAYPGDQGDSTAEALAKLNSLQPNQPKKPSITQSVVVQTIEEKNLKKLIRKCEKK